VGALSRALYGASADDVPTHVDTLQLVRVHKVCDYIITHPDVVALHVAVKHCKATFNWSDEAAKQAFADTAMFMKWAKRKDLKGYILLALNAMVHRKRVSE
jgi:hypothetical protein